MSETPLLSVGLPVYNGERFVVQAVESILSQSFADFELIIRDNASTDRTADLCREFAARDQRVAYTRSPENVGAAENYNAVFRQARGKYFKWIAHDDAYAPAFLARCVETMESDPGAVLCYSSAVFIDESGAEIGVEEETLSYDDNRPTDRFRTWVFENRAAWCHPITGVIRTDALRDGPLIGKFVGADYTLVAELALRGRIRRLPERLFYRRDHPGRSTAGRPSTEQVVSWYDPKARRRRSYMTRWRWARELGCSVARVPMSPYEKVVASGMIARWAIRQRRALARELWRALGGERKPSDVGGAGSRRRDRARS